MVSTQLLSAKRALQMTDRWQKVAVVTPSFGLLNRQTNQELQESVFAIRSSVLTKLESLPKGINERLMTLRIKLKGNQYLTLVSSMPQPKQMMTA